MSMKLTAEQVRKAILIGGFWDEDTGMYYANRIGMQAIADELNAALDGMDSCRLYLSDKESNYKKLFGTPEKAAQLIADNCEYLDYCGHCLIRAANCDGKYLTVLEWLRGDAE